MPVPEKGQKRKLKDGKTPRSKLAKTSSELSNDCVIVLSQSQDDIIALSQISK